MRTARALFISLLLLSESVLASGEYHQAGTRSASMAKASVALSDVWCTFNNQAGLAKLSAFTGAIYYENHFLLKETSYKAAAFAAPLKTGTIGFAYSQYGFSKYAENKFGLAYAFKLSDHIAAGVQLDYYLFTQQEIYPNNRFLTFEAGVQGFITEKLTIGVHVYNPVYRKISRLSPEKTDCTFRIGAAYKCTRDLTVTMEGDKSSSDKPQFKAGVEYSIQNRFEIRAGVSTDPSFFTFGAGMNFGKLHADFGFAWHQLLGYSPSTSLIYAF